MNIAAFDIRAYLDSMQVSYWEHGRNVSKGWLGTQCIYCDDSHNHLGIHLYYKNYSCWLCHSTGSLVDLICDLESTTHHAALQRIEEYQSDILQEPDPRNPLQDEGQNILPYGCTNGLTQGQTKWLKQRRYDPETVQEKWGVVAGPLVGPWCHRIMCPVKYGGRTMTWVGIDTTGTNKAKYKAAPVEESFMPIGELPYGIDHVQGDTVLLVEGMLDAWRIGYGAIAMFGMGVNDKKMRALIELPVKTYYIMFDAEELATKNAEDLGKTLRLATGRDVYILHLGSGDPDNLDDETAKALRHDIGL